MSMMCIGVKKQSVLRTRHFACIAFHLFVMPVCATALVHLFATMKCARSEWPFIFIFIIMKCARRSGEPVILIIVVLFSLLWCCSHYYGGVRCWGPRF